MIDPANMKSGHEMKASGLTKDEIDALIRAQYLLCIRSNPDMAEWVEMMVYKDTRTVDELKVVVKAGWDKVDAGHARNFCAKVNEMWAERQLLSPDNASATLT